MSEDVIVPFPRRRRSPDVTPEMAAKIKFLLDLGMTQHDIAAHFKINQGRVSEVNTGMKFPGISSSQLDLF
ncbi:MAG: hypothetical protein EOS25_10245 [Mesorhizobium sp.]|uniref:hypothetical protein n=1 Tax=Mesorhizobium sp. TaxID=1871066 RepID=UPI000FE9C48F|nr:hypothetical protein [Mesorhizobium sp.]RWE62967.1 MAG: hypothetical protein EOS24_04950 [Mesorhizobium sp.]RWF10561.1 MAG: hypothetical protein EOS69_14370 [Mesorhizobium sp.]RWF19650.1 MAG: hypothetical protein EOS25_10245 [Mesorhizobium sp.]TIY04083.1 MAG: hypothetical protein E5V22_12485 [Mesorhizobium sp.]